jgi:hypothetical protein
VPGELRARYQPARPDEETVRPYLTVHLRGPNGSSQNLRGLVDSGADFTCLPLSIARSLGYSRDHLQGRTINQVAASVLAWQAIEPLRAFALGLPDVEFELLPVFIEQSQALWGRADFFAAFDRVAFEDETLVLTPR